MFDAFFVLFSLRLWVNIDKQPVIYFTIFSATNFIRTRPPRNSDNNEVIWFQPPLERPTSSRANRSAGAGTTTATLTTDLWELTAKSDSRNWQVKQLLHCINIHCFYFYVFLNQLVILTELVSQVHPLSTVVSWLISITFLISIQADSWLASVFISCAKNIIFQFNTYFNLDRILCQIDFRKWKRRIFIILRNS